MKTHLLTTCLVLLNVFSFSQGYHKLIRTNTYWDVYSTYNTVWCYSDASRIFFTGSDTLIDGHLYRLSRRHPFHMMDTIPLPFFCPPFDVLTTSYSTDKYIREDTLEKKVYIFCDEPFCNPPKDVLLYDFSLHIGDTLHSDYTLGAVLVCSLIDSVTLYNGEIRKQFWFTGGWTYYIESIGGRYGLLDPLVACIECGGGYFCQNENGVNLWGETCDNFFVATGNHNDEQYSILPNPAHDFIVVTSNKQSPDFEFILLNLQGREILRKSLHGQSNRISITGLSPGIYIYRINSEKRIKQGKLCVF